MSNAEERWLPIAGYEGQYEVSDKGRVRSLKLIDSGGRRWHKRPKILTGGINHGYRRIRLCDGGKEKQEYVHRLVLKAFVGEPKENEEGAHLNGIRDDNRLANLVWATSEENNGHKILQGKAVMGVNCPAAKLNEEQVRQIRNAHKQGASLTSLAKQYSVALTTISYTVKRKRWRHVE